MKIEPNKFNQEKHKKMVVFIVHTWYNQFDDTLKQKEKENCSGKKGELYITPKFSLEYNWAEERIF